MANANGVKNHQKVFMEGSSLGFIRLNTPVINTIIGITYLVFLKNFITHYLLILAM